MNPVLKRIGRFWPILVVRHRWQSFFLWCWFKGDFSTWAEAKKVTTGYDDAAVLARVVRATREVIAGRAAWERDGTTFAEPWVNLPLLHALQDVRDLSGGRLDLIDFGGGLGGTWRQHRVALGAGAVSRWRVVEQVHYVEAGAEFADEVLAFQRTLDEGQRRGAGAILLSSVLQYLEDPHALLAEVRCLGFEHVIIDRTPFARDGRDRLLVQRTPPKLGGGNYPCWFFNRDRLLAALGADYILRTEWLGFDEVDPRVEFRGFHYQRKRHDDFS